MEQLMSEIQGQAFGAPGEADFDVVLPLLVYLGKTGGDQKTAGVANNIFVALIATDDVIAARIEALLRFSMRAAEDHGKIGAAPLAVAEVGAP